MRLELTARALQDLRGIARYSIQTWGTNKARSYVDDIQDRFTWLAQNPFLGRARDDVREGYRCFRQGVHLIFYLVQADTVQIVGIPHASMDIAAYFDPN